MTTKRTYVVEEVCCYKVEATSEEEAERLFVNHGPEAFIHTMSIEERSVYPDEE